MSDHSQEDTRKLKHQRMMAQGEGCRVRILDFEGKEESGEVRIKTLDVAMRLFRAIKMFGLCLGLALAAILVPILHFILVPGFLVAGLVMAPLALVTKSIVLGGEGICPNCRAFLPIARQKHRWPLSGRCEQCHRDVTIVMN